MLGATYPKLTVRRVGLMSTLGIALAACAASPQADVQTKASAQASSQTAQPLKLPNLQPGSTCPVSAQQDFANPPGNKLPGYGFGPGPVFLSGQTQWFSGVYALILVSPAYSGKVVVRGRQLDGTNGMPFPDQLLAMQNRAIELSIQTEPLLSAGLAREGGVLDTGFRAGGVVQQPIGLAVVGRRGFIRDLGQVA